jgi:hypothetical protein
MRYVILVGHDEKGGKTMSPEEHSAFFAAYQKYHSDLSKAGVLLGGDALQPSMSRPCASRFRYRLAAYHRAVRRLAAGRAFTDRRSEPRRCSRDGFRCGDGSRSHGPTVGGSRAARVSLFAQRSRRFPRQPRPFAEPETEVARAAALTKNARERTLFLARAASYAAQGSHRP